MYLEHNENLKGQEVLIDPWIHKKTKLSRGQFLDKVDYVKSTPNSFENLLGVINQENRILH